MARLNSGIMNSNMQSTINRFENKEMPITPFIHIDCGSKHNND